MIKKLEKIWDKIEPYVQVILTLVFFLVISFLIFVFFKDAKIFNNNFLNLSIIIIFFLAIYLFIINLYYKIHKFIFLKPTRDIKEFKKLWKKEYNLARKIKKLKYNSKEYKEKWNQFEKIVERLEKDTIKFKSWFVFFIFSIYFGMLEGLPFWALKNSAKHFLKATKHFFTLKSYERGFMWYKLKGGMYIIDSFIYNNKKLKKIKCYQKNNFKK